MPVEKRPLEGQDGGEQQGGGAAVEGATNGAAAAAAASKRPKLDGPAAGKLSLEALEKAKKALELQKQLREKLKNLPQVNHACARPSAAVVAGGRAVAKREIEIVRADHCGPLTRAACHASDSDTLRISQLCALWWCCCPGALCAAPETCGGTSARSCRCASQSASGRGSTA